MAYHLRVESVGQVVIRHPVRSQHNKRMTLSLYVIYGGIYGAYWDKIKVGEVEGTSTLTNHRVEGAAPANSIRLFETMTLVPSEF